MRLRPALLVAVALGCLGLAGCLGPDEPASPTTQAPAACQASGEASGPDAARAHTVTGDARIEAEAWRNDMPTIVEPGQAPPPRNLTLYVTFPHEATDVEATMACGGESWSTPMMAFTRGWSAKGPEWPAGAVLRVTLTYSVGGTQQAWIGDVPLQSAQ